MECNDIQRLKELSGILENSDTDASSLNWEDKFWTLFHKNDDLKNDFAKVHNKMVDLLESIQYMIPLLENQEGKPDINKYRDLLLQKFLDVTDASNKVIKIYNEAMIKSKKK